MPFTIFENIHFLKNSLSLVIKGVDRKFCHFIRILQQIYYNLGVKTFKTGDFIICQNHEIGKFT